MEKLPNEFLGELHRRLNGIVDRIENGGLEYNYAVSALQMVSEGKVKLNQSILTPASTVRIDRSVRPIYPDWVEKVLHPELEKTGPAEFDVSKLKLWLHKDQKGGKWLKGQKIYEHLKDNDMLESCLGLADLIAIQAKGITFFRQHFADKAVFGWKSVVRLRDGSLSAPYLCYVGGKVVLHWFWLGYDWSGSGPALRLAS